MKAEAKVEMKKVRSSLNLDLDLSLPRAGAPIGMFALGLACLKARDDVQSCRSGGEYRDHVLQRAGSRGYFFGCNRVGSGRLDIVESGDCPYSFRRVILVRSHGDETIAERSVGRSTGLCV